MTDEAQRTREPQYEDILKVRDEAGIASFGLMSNQVWHDDPRRILFVLSRYKFVAKMLSGKDSAVEIGCADAFGSRVVRQEVANVTAVDFDPVFCENARANVDPKWPVEIREHDILDGPVEGPFEAAYTLDVLEHIEKARETLFLDNIVRSLTPHGVLIVGTPSIQSQAYASAQSKIGHINCKDAPELKALMERWFHNVFIFSMNDEVVHTGFHPMAHYLFALCCSRRDPT